MSSEKLQKILARAGLGSRREIESWIDAGRISVNRRRAKLGDRALPEDVIQVDGRIVNTSHSSSDVSRVLLYHKDVASVCSRFDERGRKTVFKDFPKIRNARWILVGRLDFNTSGLLLVTNDGELANRLMHPSRQQEREYAVRVYGKLDQQAIHQLCNGVLLDDGPAKFESIIDVGGEGRNHWYRVTLKEGRNREVRRIFETQDVRVNRLSRIRFGVVTLPRSLPRGKCRELNVNEVNALRSSVGLAAHKLRRSGQEQVDSGKPASNTSSRAQRVTLKRSAPNRKSSATSGRGEAVRSASRYTKRKTS